MPRFVLAFLCLGCFPLTGFAQDNFPDVPESHSQVRKFCVIRFRLASFGVDDPRHGASSGPPATMKDCAKVLIDGIDRLPTTLAEHLKEAAKPERCRPDAGYDRTQIVLYKSTWRRDLEAAMRIVEPEIKKLGRDPRELQTELDKNQKIADKIAEVWAQKMTQAGGKPLFTDVPVDHWAWAAVQDLRDAGILVGYPGDRFEG
jgi:hypothetical protein